MSDSNRASHGRYRPIPSRGITAKYRRRDSNPQNSVPETETYAFPSLLHKYLWRDLNPHGFLRHGFLAHRICHSATEVCMCSLRNSNPHFVRFKPASSSSWNRGALSGPGWSCTSDVSYVGVLRTLALAARHTDPYSFLRNKRTACVDPLQAGGL